MAVGADPPDRTARGTKGSCAPLVSLRNCRPPFEKREAICTVRPAGHWTGLKRQHLPMALQTAKFFFFFSVFEQRRFGGDRNP